MSFTDALERHNHLFRQLVRVEDTCRLLADEMEGCFRSGGKLLLMGNGGSAADCQHLAAEFVVRYKTDRQPLAAMALTVDTSILTAHANDYDYSSVFTRQVRALCKPVDLIIGISTSGNSPNIIDAIEAGKAIGARTWGWTGQSGGKLVGIADHLLRIPHTETARIQEAHLFIGHWLCETLENRMSE
ncbi:MAG: D-sedoheptulose 7-phosphate isomerase [Candidatus Kentron sp. G]|uniref:D-sedoheptulose 7-phosphate isomerase n=1 Tax=Candidatus Kentrum sp. FM TaxID=2126340 RepID=A0A450SE05_9GAMM|nr:MAG: D-sedoheptulose 7-phosphate isomerase [Candidatus Kentron sp. FM]VFM97555.1 MAG: D-sedoheptulose 7-phosphate isomerase [Candidatus Kentron sp. G]VFJ51865.1 MAG: D-sedoheptulose 7-phosphate isomerase [Candidatus Kentron sp. FM]VFK11412.1 MAG: D-sedoheptulose 7-phosphate isomerase [Candidatus Kentron sp. FM]VFM99776.1 MAG: D-sedoheptulose 7-phosphate isomerase [Candidatus Kentron sp. G]